MLDATPSALGTSNIKYYVDPSATFIPYSFFNADDTLKINPAFALVTLNAATFKDSAAADFAMGGLGVVNDYIRDLAKQELGSLFLTNLFTNEKDVQQSLVDGAAVKAGEIATLLSSLSGTGNHSNLVGDSPLKYTTDVFNSPDNVCRVLFQGLFAQAPGRFAPPFDSVSRIQLPFLENDSIVFTLVCDNSDQRAGQNTGWATPASVLNRKYKIRLILKTEPSNPCADALAALFITEVGSPVFVPPPILGLA